MEDFGRTSKEYEQMKIIQNHSGKGDNIGGNKMINNNISGNDNITIQGIQSSEINLY
jgi:hypothetical protein